MKAKRPPVVEDRSVLDIDKFNLDEEWIGQPGLYFEWSEKLADARRSLDIAKSRADITAAETSTRIRSREAVKKSKVTEPLIKAMIEQDRDNQEAQMAVIRAKHRVDVLSGMVTALDHRKKALENIVQLDGRQYFAQPTAKDRDTKDRMTTAKQKAVLR